MKALTSITGIDLNDVGAHVRGLEAGGFGAVTSQENQLSPFLPLAVAATHSQTIELRTNVAIAFARSPMAAASVAWDLQTASRGRFTLGLGSQVKGHNVRRFSVPWSPPAPRMREYVQSLHAIWDCWQNGTKLDYQGEHYQFSLMTPNFMPDPQEHGLPKVQIAAVGPVMMKVAAEECDGVMLHSFCTRRYLDEVVVPRLKRGLAASGRDLDGFDISGGGFVATGADDEVVSEVYEWVRMRVGFYGSTPSYWPVFEVHGLEDLGHKLNAMSKKGQWDEMTKEIPDDVVDLFVAAGRFDQIEAVIRERFGSVVSYVGMPQGTPVELLQDLARI
ncbi:MAG: TIGR03617 family F420-dependent LLM class oxidoreductase [Pseudomonadales bacterium]|nr:TIGR03617 family F420-dependent LLM class oxidoreductase [Pseudomonadales bacterium]MDP6472776.1 TIGR03617 family F420-dependent LLM class oxidoreductase [Pseudomonadales bacterium]MDP6827989.1 TIGR03617 family F420-dependent LLM class oxidoreductase [Pseudomonadales bacterium]MDP6972888.1 TIGR03617 family F420-dependent LLM class oxidoreductase [Pseudomonadales bacterium]